MRFLRASNGQALVIAPQDEINSGGEARIYSVASDSSLVAKIYRQAKKETARKLRVMLENPPSDPTAAQGHASIAWPVDLVRSDDGEGAVLGYLMPRVVGARPVIDLYNPISRRETCPLFSYQYLYRTAHNMAAVMQALHNRDYVIGDVNESNILVTDTALITVVDTDSFQVRDASGGTIFHCPVAKPEFTPAELQGKLLHYIERTPAHDRFGLAVLIFQLLMEGTHPFAGVYTGEDDPPPYEARIAAGHFPHGSLQTPYRPLPFAPPLAILPANIHYLFMRCFQDGHENPQSRPDASAWVKALRAAEHDLIACEVNDQHRYGNHLDTCPWCERTTLLGGRDPFPSKERVQRGHHLQPIAAPVQTALPSAAAPSDAAAPTQSPATVDASGPRTLSDSTAAAPFRPVSNTPPASRITYVQRAATAPLKTARYQWLVPVAILLIVAAAAIPLSLRKWAPTGAKPGPNGFPSTVAHQIAGPDLQLLFTPAQEAASSGDSPNLKALLDQAPQLTQSVGKDGWTLLHFASYHGQSAAEQLLINAGADVNAKEKDGFTPLHLAAQEGKTEAAKTLIEKGAQLNAQESVGWTPLHFAAQEGRVDVANLLLAHGADPNIKDKKGLTPLTVATEENRSRLADVIRKRGGLP